MKKIIIVLGAIAAVLLMVSTVTAVPQAGRCTFIEKDDAFESLEKILGKNTGFKFGNGNLIILILRIIFRAIFICPASALNGFLCAIFGGCTTREAIVYAIIMYFTNLSPIEWE